MGEVRQHVAIVQARHGDFRNNHLQEGRERREDAELVVVEAEAGGGREVAALHDARGYKDLGVLLVDRLQAGRTLKITCGALVLPFELPISQLTVDDKNLLRSFLLAERIKDLVDRLTEDSAANEMFSN